MTEADTHSGRANDPRGFSFDIEHLKTDLKGRSVRSGTITLVSEASKLVLGIGSTAVLARLLTPNDFGLIAMVTAITGFIALFRDLGLSMATVQHPELNNDQVSMLFWINFAVSAFLMLVTAAAAPLIAWFYSEPRLVLITIAFASAFIAGGLSVQHQALLRRHMRFTALAVADLVALCISIGVGIGSAWLGAGYWALVFMALARGLTGAIVLWVLCPWRPGLPRRHSRVRSMLAFGANLTGFNILNYFARNLDNVLIGRVSGPVQLGLYAKAYQLLLFPIQQVNQPVSTVAMPALSRLQNDPKRFLSYYRKGLQLLVTLGMPIVVFVFVDVREVVLTLLGPQWMDTVGIFRWLAPAAFVGTFNVSESWVCLSLGKSRRLLEWAILSSSIVVAAFFVGIRWGAIGIAAAYSITACALRYPSLAYCLRDTLVKPADVLRALWKPAFASIAAGAILFATQPFLHFPHVVISLTINAAIYGLAYLGVWCILPQGARTLLEMLSLAKELRPSRSRPKTDSPCPRS